MKSAEMKMKKFEILIRDIDEYLGKTGIYGYKTVSKVLENGDEITEKVYISPLEYILDINEKTNENNKYLKIIYDNCFQHRGLGYGSDKCFELERIEIDNTTKFIETIRRCNSCTKSSYGYYPTRCGVPKHLLFWLIFIVSIDNDNYNENLSVVSDVAYLLGFDEKKLEDWITAVKGVLEGKKLNEMKYQTEDAKAFFVR